MRGFLHLARAAGALALVGLALTVPQAGAITNGTPDTTHLNVGMVFINDLPVQFGFGSGSLIAPDELLTAGHLTALLTAYGLTPDEVSITFDDQYSVSAENVISAAHTIAVTGWETDPNYGGYIPSDHIVDDVGVIHLAEPVTGVTPIELPEVGFLDGLAAKGELVNHEFLNVGYGVNGLDRSVYSSQRNRIWNHRREVSSTPFKALTPNNLKQFGGSCFGDSGGPHFYGGSYPNLAVAITSTGDPTCGTEDAEQRLDTQSVHDFLSQFIP